MSIQAELEKKVSSMTHHQTLSSDSQPLIERERQVRTEAITHPGTAFSPGPEDAFVGSKDMLARRDRLVLAASQLKTEMIGMDAVIDRVIDAIRAWYVLPGLIQRPVIVCLWGLTGTGKTQLVRRLAQLLGFYDRFVEVQMDGFSHGASARNTTISGLLSDSGIREGQPGILVLDEFQRLRTVDKNNGDVKQERYSDLWALLSDGKLPPPLYALASIERKLADALFEAEREDSDEAQLQQKRRFKLDVWDAQELRDLLKLPQSLAEIMQWSPHDVEQALKQFQRTQASWETDYTRLLVMVCGNLDEMYHQTAQRVHDCDTDADVFHQLTKDLSIIDVKKALRRRFRPEQIARLGNLHVVYPSLSKATYRALIQKTCDAMLDAVDTQTGVRFELSAEVLDEIYANAVFPTQGTRPLFSSIHAILSTHLVEAALWVHRLGMDPHAQPNRPIQLTLSSDRKQLALQAFQQVQGRWEAQRTSFPLGLELQRLKQRANKDFRALLAVHEAGHALVYALLLNMAPQEVKINIASFEGGYVSFALQKATTQQTALDLICVGLAGRAAEAAVFGEQHCTSGAQHDLEQATRDAAIHVRLNGFAGRLSRTDVASEPNEHLNTDVVASNEAIESILQEQYQRARHLLADHKAAFLKVVEALEQRGLLEPRELQQMLQAQGLPIQLPTDDADHMPLAPFADHLRAFSQAGV
jgi:hypothetical protein